MDTDKTDVTVVGRGVLNAFWFGLIVFIAALVINEVSAHNNSGGWSTLSRGLSMAFIIFGAGVYCLFFSVIALSELVSNRKNGNVDTTRTMIALTFPRPCKVADGKQGKQIMRETETEGQKKAP